ncbi:MAG: methyltransferase domain-containing protein, partial [Candidatus Aenigmarchaeota archaeon]|nr:methyltransferase domain-containing protein [Candidatus Aenigmarchaeota archaeon]
AQGAEVVGADISEDCVRHAALEAKGLPTRFALGAIEALPFLPGSFDVVVASHIIEHVREPARILGDLLACLRPGGRLLLTTPNYRSLWPLAEMVFDHALAEEAYSLHEQHVTKFFPGLLRRLLKDAGFTGIRMESHYILTLPLSLVSRRGADTLLALEKRLASLPFGTILYAQAVRPA